MSRPMLFSSGILEQEASLWCVNCQEETPHHVHYVAGLLHWVRCERCRQRWDVNHLLLLSLYCRMFPGYCRMFPGRITTKTLRVGVEVRRHPLRFAASLPKRVLTKPLQIVDEAVDLVGLAH